MIRFRNTSQAFAEGAEICVKEEDSILRITWRNGDAGAELTVDFVNEKFEINEKKYNIKL